MKNIKTLEIGEYPEGINFYPKKNEIFDFCSKPPPPCRGGIWLKKCKFQ